MIKSEIRSLIKNELPKFDKTSKYHPRFLDAAIEKVINELYTDVFKENPLGLQRFTKPYGYDTALAVSTDAVIGLAYTTLPAKIVPFTDKASGVRRVSTVIQGGLTFFPMAQNEMDYVLSGSNVDSVSTRIGYAVTQERVEYYNMTATVSSAGVRMDLIVPFSVYADTDNVLIPEITDRQGETFVDKVLKMLGVIGPVDLADDNADKEQPQNNRQ